MSKFCIATHACFWVIEIVSPRESFLMVLLKWWNVEKKKIRYYAFMCVNAFSPKQHHNAQYISRMMFATYHFVGVRCLLILPISFRISLLVLGKSLRFEECIFHVIYCIRSWYQGQGQVIIPYIYCWMQLLAPASLPASDTTLLNHGSVGTIHLSVARHITRIPLVAWYNYEWCAEESAVVRGHILID